ncbi:MAG: hypothetical protein V1753_12170, partial [Pseudomonadota bacterium]
FRSLRQEIQKGIHAIAASKSAGELQVHIAYKRVTRSLTSLVGIIRRLKLKSAYRFDSSVEGFRSYAEHLEKVIARKTVCKICRLRPAEKPSEEDDVCKICLQRRRKNNSASALAKKHTRPSETVFISEIADQNRRSAFIVARFGLDEWLNGDMIHSLFVVEPHTLQREVEGLPWTRQFNTQEEAIKKSLQDKSYGTFNYKRIKDDIDSFDPSGDKDRAKHVAFLYHRRNELDPEKVKLDVIFDEWQAMVKRDGKDLAIDDSAYKKDVLLYNLITAKTPTPSTILDVWDTTLEFFQAVSTQILHDLLPSENRLKLRFDGGNGTLEKWPGTLQAEVVQTREKIELLFQDGNHVEVIGKIYSGDTCCSEWISKDIGVIHKNHALYDKCYKVAGCESGEEFVRCRTITMSSNLFLAIVPADRAPEISDLIYQRYLEHFGKALGRLPFSIGNLFFGEKMPMFVVLDAAKRMIDNFDKLAQKKNRKSFSVGDSKPAGSFGRILELKCKLGELNRTVTWTVPHQLGNCEPDYHHPYFIIAKSNSSQVDDRSSWFRTIVGDVIHPTEIKKDDTLSICPNYYDFEFLDSNARRYDLTSDEGRRRSSVAAFRSRPILLDELSQKMIHLWKGVFQGKQFANLSDTQLKALQSLWLSRYQSWDVSLENRDTSEYKTWKALVDASIQESLGSLSADQLLLLKETICNGLFFDTLELYMGVLKERIAR